MSGFPNVIGAIDGTHNYKLPAPRKHPENYVNRKGHYSIQLQVSNLSSNLTMFKKISFYCLFKNRLFVMLNVNLSIVMLGMFVLCMMHEYYVYQK